MRTWILAGVLVMLPGSAYAQQDQQELRPSCSHAKLEMARFMHGLPPGAGDRGARTGSADTDVIHNALDIELDPANTWLGGSNTTTIKSLVDGLSTYQFQLDSVLPVGDVKVNGNAAAWTRLDSANLQVTLDPPIALNDVFTLYVAYSGHPTAGAGLGSITFRQRNGAPEVSRLLPYRHFTTGTAAPAFCPIRL